MTIPVSGTPISVAKAKQMHPLIYPDDSDEDSFKGGTGWLKRFKHRHGIRGLSVQGESMSAATESVNGFTKRLKDIMEEKQFTLNMIFNCDETGLLWKLLPNKTLVSAKEKQAKGFKKPKDRVTLMACCNATGTIKLPLVFIHKPAKPLCFRQIDMASLPFDYYSQKNSWMDSSIFNKWFFEKFIPKCRVGLRELGVPQRALLLLDNAPSHPDVEMLSSDDGQISCLFLPPNTTSILQPMDQGILQTIKQSYKRDLLMRMLKPK